MRRLNIFIDETGNFGFEKDNSKLYGVSFIFHDSKNNITNEIEHLNQKLQDIGYSNMIHMADLVSNRGEYKQYDFETRKKIFWTIFTFTKRINIKVVSIFVNKKYLADKTLLKNKLIFELATVVNGNQSTIEKYDKVTVYYDGGQKELEEIIETIFAGFSNLYIKKKFDQKEKRLFQVTDMLTFIDKLEYKRKNKLEMTKSELSFFTKKNMRIIMNSLKNKRL